LALAMFFRYTRARLLTGGIGSQAQDRGGREGPREVSIAALGARAAVPRARGLLGACPQTALGDNRLHPGTAMKVMDCIAPTRARSWPTPGIERRH
jgi:hypothetical protein